MTTPTPEAFLAAPSEPEEDHDDFGLELPFSERQCLASIAESMRIIAELVVRRDVNLLAEDESKQALDQLDREYAELESLHDAKQQLIEDTLKICSKSTSKLANQIRALLEVPVAVPSVEPTPEPNQPDHDADVEEWREYARARGTDLAEPDALDSMNRSQIRTLLGINHTEES